MLINYKGGYLGYNKIYHYSNIQDFYSLSNNAFSVYYENFKTKIENYLKEIPEDQIYSLLPV